MQERNFEFELDLEKAEKTADGRLLVSGVASTTSVDLQNDSFSPNALKSMCDGAVGVPLVNSHNHELGDEIGKILKSYVEDNKLYVQGELDSDDVLAQRLFKKIQRSGKAGFSVGASLLAVKPGINKSHRILDDVRLNHIMLTSKPVNKDCFAVAISKALIDVPVENIEKADVSDEQRKEHATYTENGEGKFPIFNKATAESALKLIGKAPADKQPAVRAKACKILGDSHPACAAKKSEDTMDKETIEKSGAKFSDDTKSALMNIHASGNDVTKGQVKDLLGADWPEAGTDQADVPDHFEAPDAPIAEPDKSQITPDSQSNEMFMGIAKAVEDALALKTADLDAKIAELTEAIKVFKSQTATLTVSKTADIAPVPKMSVLDIHKSTRNQTDFMQALLVKATQGG